MGAVFGFLEIKFCAADDDFAAVFDVAVDGVFQGKESRAAVVERKGVDAEGGFESGVFIEVGDDDFWDGIAFEFDDEADGFVGFVADVGDAFEFFVFDEVGDVLDELFGVHVVGNFGDDELFFAGAAFFDADASANFDAAAAGAEIFFDGRGTADEAAGGEIRSGDDFH